MSDTTPRGDERPGGGVRIEHRGRTPNVHPSAYVAPNATLCGDVHVHADARVLFGAVVSAEDGRVEIGERSIVMENALVRGRRDHPVHVDADVLIGPHAHVNGTTIERQAFLATGVATFPGAVIGLASEVRINAVVHVNTRLAPHTTVPIGWVAVGDPAQILPPDQHDAIWDVQRTLDFPQTVYGIARGADGHERNERQSAWFGHHRYDRILGA